MLALEAQTGLIFLAFRSNETVKGLIYKATQTKPIYDFFCAENIKQTVWRVALTEEFTRAFAKEVRALYVADGHHRVEAALAAREVLRARNANHTGAEDYNFFVAGMFPAEDLQILPYNRAVKDLNDLTEVKFFERLRENFAVGETDRKQPVFKNEFSMYLAGKWYKLKFNASSALPRPLHSVETLDASVLQDYVLRPVLGIEDPRTDKRVAFVGGRRGAAELERLVDSGEARAAFSLRPVTTSELFAVSDAGEMMPPKSTWFEPKLRDGLLVHVIENK